MQKYQADRPIRWRWPLITAFAGAAAYGISLVLARMPARAESLYGEGIGPLIARPLSLLTGRVPFSLGDILIAAYVLWLAALLLGARKAIAAKRRSLRNALGGGLRRVVRDLGLIVLLFYVVWGWNYARPTYVERAGWPQWEDASAEELLALAEAASMAANQAYLDLHGVADVGHPTVFPDDTLDIDESLNEGWKRAAERLALQPPAGRPYGRVKWPLGGIVLRWLGVTGIYFPFTAEANVVRGLPAMRAPTVMAHEQAHQRGITSEGEANFLGFVVASLAPGRLSRYSAAVYAHGEMVAALARVDRDAARRLVADRFPGVQRDIDAVSEFYRRHVSRIASNVQRSVNDRYLRANRVPGGVGNYGLGTRLLIEYARQHHGRLFAE
ncbi:MAG: DUF3810 family protein [Gemmatimonadota bacterium]|jgi:hypothetical protein